MFKQYALLFLSYFLLLSPVWSQTAQMDANQINATIHPDGLFFSDSGVIAPGFESPKGSGIHSIFSTSLWIGGINANNSSLASVSALHKGSSYFYTGPLSVVQGSGGASKKDFGPADITPQVEADYNHVFAVTKQEVEQFKNWFACSNDPACNTGVLFPNYTVPQSIQTWPAHGDTAAGQPRHLAPFFDVNGDDTYDHAQGDFPCIKGDKYAFFVMNDKGSTRDYDTIRTRIGVEVQVGVYAFDKDPSGPLANTVFVEYDVINNLSSV